MNNYKVEVTIQLKDRDDNILTTTTIRLDPVKVPPATYEVVQRTLSEAIKDGKLFEAIDREEKAYEY